MSLRIHLSKSGRHGQRLYRIIVSEKDGKPIDYLGSYNPQDKIKGFEVNRKQISEWINKGAKPSLTVQKLLNEKHA